MYCGSSASIPDAAERAKRVVALWLILALGGARARSRPTVDFRNFIVIFWAETLAH